MNRRLQLARRLPRFQFSLRSLFILTTVVAVSLAIGRWNVDVGGMAAIFAIGTWWTGVAVSAYWYRTAYYLTAFTLGLVIYGAMLLPLSVLAIYAYATFPSVGVVLCLCFASLGAAALMRPWIVTEENGLPLRKAVVWSYATAFLFLCELGVVAEIVDLHTARFGLLLPDWRSIGLPILVPLSETLELGLVAAFFVVALSFYLTIPTGLLVLAILRGIGNLAISRDEVEQNILLAVDVLQALDRNPIGADEIARRAGYDRDITNEFLDRLHAADRLRWSAEHGYSRDS